MDRYHACLMWHVTRRWGGGSQTKHDTVVPDPLIGAGDLASDKAFRALVAVVLRVVSVGVSLLTRCTTGRQLQAIRGSEVAAQSIGISPVRTRVVVFGISAAIAGLGGALLAIHQENVNYGSNFSPDRKSVV